MLLKGEWVGYSQNTGTEEGAMVRSKTEGGCTTEGTAIPEEYSRFRLLLRYGVSGHSHTIRQKQTEPVWRIQAQVWQTLKASGALVPYRVDIPGERGNHHLINDEKQVGHLLYDIIASRTLHHDEEEAQLRLTEWHANLEEVPIPETETETEAETETESDYTSE